MPEAIVTAAMIQIADVSPSASAVMPASTASAIATSPILLNTPEAWSEFTGRFVDAWRARYGRPNLPAVLFVDRNGVVLARIDSSSDETALRLMIATAAAKRAK